MYKKQQIICLAVCLLPPTYFAVGFQEVQTRKPASSLFSSSGATTIAIPEMKRSQITVPMSFPENPWTFGKDMVDTAASHLARTAIDWAGLPTRATGEKQHNLSNDQLANVIQNDVSDNNVLVTADMTRSIYDDKCTFKDGSNLDGSYPMEPWVLGCRMLFHSEHSVSRIVDQTLHVTEAFATFRFEGELQFRGPFSPRVHLAGRILMKRSRQTGLIVSYEEFWDDNVMDIVKNAQLQFA